MASTDTQIVEVTIRVEVSDAYDGDHDPDTLQGWLMPWLSSYVSFYAPTGIVAVDDDGSILAGPVGDLALQT